MSFEHLVGKPWFMPKFSRPEAEYFLSQSAVGTFVIRPSSTPDCLALSQKNDDGEIFHARILCIRRGGQYVGYSIGGDSEVFSTVDALLKRVQPKTKLVAPSPNDPRSSARPMGAGMPPPAGMMGGGGMGGGPPSYPNPHMTPNSRALSERGGRPPMQPGMGQPMMGQPGMGGAGQFGGAQPRPMMGGPMMGGGQMGGGQMGGGQMGGGQMGGQMGGGGMPPNPGGSFRGAPGPGPMRQPGMVPMPGMGGPPQQFSGRGGPGPVAPGPGRGPPQPMGRGGPMGGPARGGMQQPQRGGMQQPQQQQGGWNQQPETAVSGFAPGSVLERSTQIDMSELMFEKEIGAGSFGTVYKGQWKSWTVAIKQLKNAVPEDSDEYQDFVREAELMTRLRPHDNVVRFVGVTKPPNLCVRKSARVFLFLTLFLFQIVLEFVARGSMYDLLQSDEQLTGEMMLMMLKGICSGMAHLHEENVVHRDLAARNVLLDHNLVPKLGDFGMSRVLAHSEKSQTKSDTGPLKWMSPESIRNREYSRKSDVWAFAVVITEVLTRCSEPYPDLEPIQVATRVAYENLVPPVPPGASACIIRVLQTCSERDPTFRPEFSDISDWLQWERSAFA